MLGQRKSQGICCRSHLRNVPNSLDLMDKLQTSVYFKLGGGFGMIRPLA